MIASEIVFPDQGENIIDKQRWRLDRGSDRSKNFITQFMTIKRASINDPMLKARNIDKYLGDAPLCFSNCGRKIEPRLWAALANPFPVIPFFYFTFQTIKTGMSLLIGHIIYTYWVNKKGWGWHKKCSWVHKEHHVCPKSNSKWELLTGHRQSTALVARTYAVYGDGVYHTRSLGPTARPNWLPTTKRVTIPNNTPSERSRLDVSNAGPFGTDTIPFVRLEISSTDNRSGVCDLDNKRIVY